MQAWSGWAIVLLVLPGCAVSSGGDWASNYGGDPVASGGGGGSSGAVGGGGAGNTGTGAGPSTSGGSNGSGSAPTGGGAPSMGGAGAGGAATGGAAGAGAGSAGTGGVGTGGTGIGGGAGAGGAGAGSGGSSGTGATGGAGTCCTIQPTPGCSSSAISTCVCKSDSYCCQVSWDDICVGEVTSMGCGTCGAGGAGTGGAGAGGAASGGTGGATGGGGVGGADYCLQRLNYYRAQNGSPPLKLDACLNSYATDGSKALSQNHMPHQHFMSTAPGPCGAYAENQGDPNGWMPAPIEKQIDQILAMMMAEGPGGGHHDIILSPQWSRVGVGLLNPGGALYFTNDFGP